MLGQGGFLEGDTLSDNEFKGSFSGPAAAPDRPHPAASDSSAAAADAASSGKRLDGMEQIALHDKVVEVLRTCYDPEIPVNIYELGLVYEVNVEPTANVVIRMTLTSPNCPVAGSLPIEVREKAKAVPGVAAVKVDLVWEPAWDPSKMTEAARLQLGMF
jgi:FeS assembly SUF system protein